VDPRASWSRRSGASFHELRFGWRGVLECSNAQSFVFKDGDSLLFDVKIRAAPLTEEGDVYFPEGTVIEVQRAETKAWTKGAHVLSRDGDKCTVQVGSEVLADVAVSRIQVPLALHKVGPIADNLIGHSKGIKRILLERNLITPASKLKGACTSAGKAKRKAA